MRCKIPINAIASLDPVYSVNHTPYGELWNAQGMSPMSFGFTATPAVSRVNIVSLPPGIPTNDPDLYVSFDQVSETEFNGFAAPSAVEDFPTDLEWIPISELEIRASPFNWPAAGTNGDFDVYFNLYVCTTDPSPTPTATASMVLIVLLMGGTMAGSWVLSRKKTDNTVYRVVQVGALVMAVGILLVACGGEPEPGPQPSACPVPTNSSTVTPTPSFTPVPPTVTPVPPTVTPVPPTATSIPTTAVPTATASSSPWPTATTVVCQVQVTDSANIVANGGLNLREQPTSNADIDGKLNVGDVRQAIDWSATEENNGWWQVLEPSSTGGEAWAYAGQEYQPPYLEEVDPVACAHLKNYLHGTPYPTSGPSPTPIPNAQGTDLIDVIPQADEATASNLIASICSQFVDGTQPGEPRTYAACVDYFNFVQATQTEPTYQEMFCILTFNEFNSIGDTDTGEVSGALVQDMLLEAFARQYYEVAGSDGNFFTYEELFSYLGGIEGWYGHDATTVVVGREPLVDIYNRCLSAGNRENTFYNRALGIWQNSGWRNGYECIRPARWGNLTEAQVPTGDPIVDACNLNVIDWIFTPGGGGLSIFCNSNSPFLFNMLVTARMRTMKKPSVLLLFFIITITLTANAQDSSMSGQRLVWMNLARDSETPCSEPQRLDTMLK